MIKLSECPQCKGTGRAWNGNLCACVGTHITNNFRCSLCKGRGITTKENIKEWKQKRKEFNAWVKNTKIVKIKE